MQVEIEQNNGFQIYIDFVKSEGDPSRVFHSMAELIEAFEQIDLNLAGMFGGSTATQLVLDDLEAGSLRSWLRNIILNVPDEAIAELDVKKLIGHFLLKAKYKIVEWLAENEKIVSIDQVRALEGELLRLADESNVKSIPAYVPINTRTLLSQINSIQIAVSRLDERDAVRYESPVGNKNISRGIVIEEGLIREILTRQTLISEGERIVKVKKPDYLGRSKWVVRHAGHSVEAKFEDYEWLQQFQGNAVALNPGDSLRVVMREEVSYGYENEVVHVSYTIKKVVGIVPPSRQDQSPLNF